MRVLVTSNSQIISIGRPHQNCGHILIVGLDGGVLLLQNGHQSGWAEAAMKYWLSKQLQRLSAFLKIVKPYCSHVVERRKQWLEWKVTRDAYFVCCVCFPSVTWFQQRCAGLPAGAHPEDCPPPNFSNWRRFLDTKLFAAQNPIPPPPPSAHAGY